MFTLIWALGMGLYGVAFVLLVSGLADHIQEHTNTRLKGTGTLDDVVIEVDDRLHYNLLGMAEVDKLLAGRTTPDET